MMEAPSTADPIRRVGFVGLGRMGAPMAAHLARAGFELIVADARADAVSTFVAAHGGREAASLAALGAESDAVVTMLPTSRIVRQVVLGDGGDGIAAGLRPGTVVIDMSTSDPVDTRRLGEALAERGVAVIDAPVAGGVVFAKDATLDIMTGGDAEVAARCRPLFEAMGRGVVHCGSLGAAHAMKAINNYVNAGTLLLAVEGLTIGRRFGLDVGTMMDSLVAATTGRNHPLEKKVRQHILNRRFATGMAIGLIAKDVGIAVDTAAAIGAPAPMAERVSALWREAADLYGFDRDQSEIARMWEDRAGVTLGDDA